MERALGGARSDLGAILPHARRLGVATVAMCGLLAASAAFVLYQGRGTTFYYDEWSIWGARRSFAGDSLFTPVNGHDSAIPILLFNTLREITGGVTYVPYRLLFVAYHLCFLVLLFVFARRRLGGGLAVCAVAPLAFLGSGWLVFLMTFQGLQAVGCLIAAVGALLLLERNDRIGDFGAGALLVLALFSFGTGLAVLAGIGVWIAWTRSWRRVWVVVVPAALFGIWYLKYRPASGFQPRDVALIPSYVADGAAAGMGSYTSLGQEWGRVLALGTAAVLVAMVWRAGRISAQLAAIVSMGAAFWALIAITRGPELGPGELRYLYTGAAFVALTWILLLPPMAPTRRQVLIAAILSVAATIPNVQAFRDAAASQRRHSAETRVDLFAIETARATVDPQFRPTDPPLDAGLYLRTIAGGQKSLALSEDQLRHSPEALRERADRTLVQALRLRLAPAGVERARRGGRPAIERVSDARVLETPACVAVSPTGGKPGVLEARVREGPVVVEARGGAAELRLRRFADAFPGDPFASAQPGGAQVLAVPKDRSRAPWHVQVSSASPFRLCGGPTA